MFYPAFNATTLRVPSSLATPMRKIAEKKTLTEEDVLFQWIYKISTTV